MGKYQDEAKQLLELVGGKENVVSVTHCATRMRFALADDAKANVKAIQQLPTVKGTFTNAGQFQVIIGNDVADFSKDFLAGAGIQEASKEDVKKAAAQSQPFLQRMVAHLAEIFVPLIPALVAGGLMLGLNNFLGAALPALGGKTPIESFPFLQPISQFMVWIGVAVFGMIPVLVSWSTTRKFGGTQILGIVLGLMLILPGFMLNAYTYSAIATAGGNVRDVLINGDPKAGIKAGEYVLNLGFYKILMIGYQAQVLPAMFAAFTLNYVE